VRGVRARLEHLGGGSAPGLLRRNIGLVVLALALTVAIVLWWRHPIASGREYLLGLEITGALFVVWLAWAGLARIFPVLAVGMLAIAVLLAPRFRILTAMLLATTVFLLVSPTPEPQYLPVVLLLFLGALLERGLGEPRPTSGPRSGDVRPTEVVTGRGARGFT
jgi:hypothetical protein